jgi:hypothetical protein
VSGDDPQGEIPLGILALDAVLLKIDVDHEGSELPGGGDGLQLSGTRTIFVCWQTNKNSDKN